MDGYGSVGLVSDHDVSSGQVYTRFDLCVFPPFFDLNYNFVWVYL